MKNLTEAQAWRTIAKKFEEDYPRHGLCHEVDTLAWSARISEPMREKMKARVNQFSEDTGGHFWKVRVFPFTRFRGASQDAADDCRVIAAGIMAAQADARESVVYV